MISRDLSEVISFSFEARVTLEGGLGVLWRGGGGGGARGGGGCCGGWCSW